MIYGVREELDYKQLCRTYHSVSGSFGFSLSAVLLSFKDLDDAATIDGCSKFMTYIRIYLPLSGSLLSTLTILKFVATWNDFLYPLVITNDVKMYTAARLATFRGVAGVEWNLLMAGTLTILPIMIVCFRSEKLCREYCYHRFENKNMTNKQRWVNALKCRK